MATNILVAPERADGVHIAAVESRCARTVLVQNIGVARCRFESLAFASGMDHSR